MGEKIILSLGSNIGNRDSYLIKALEKLMISGIKILGISSRYITEPLGFKDQDNFLNIVIYGETKLDPNTLLSLINTIEKSLNRVRIIKDGPRTIDIDIITYGSQKIDNNQLTIPHPRYRDRRFVLEPLKEIVPDFIDPIVGDRIESIRSKCKDVSDIKRDGNLDVCI